ncbi:MAG: tyrosinase family protein [Pyrinomonadaceae bacterium]
MTDSNFSRRDFIKGLGIAGGFSLLGASAGAQVLPKFIFQKRCKDAGAIIRKSFKTLTAAELTAYKNGVAVMKSRPLTDPTSWGYQAAIHGTFNTPVHTAWNTCQHNTTFFLSWHRMYLCFFERILRKASGNANFGLPYWNYSDAADPLARYLPSAFRNPANATNSLYDGTRNPALNNGSAQLSAAAVSLASVIPGPTTFYPMSNNVQSTPHNVVHGSIGGDMGSFQTAGLDPIFWLHHCNIDRLWNKWLAGGGGRSNPPASDTAWQNTNFTFFNENGAQVQMKGADIVDAAYSDCRSCYDEEAFYTIWNVLQIRYKYIDILLGYYRKPIVLDIKRLRFELELNDKARESFANARKAAAKPEDELNFRLNFEDVKANKPVEFFYEVYLNLPENVTEPDYKSEYYAGNISFFGADSMSGMTMPMKNGEMEPLKFSVNVSDAIRRSKIAGVGKLSVTLIPTGLVSKDEKRLPIRSDAKISVGQITLSLEQREK